MRFTSFFSSVLPVALLLTASGSQAACPPTLTKLFTAYIENGLSTKPIAIPGGARIVEPTLGGNLTGPMINGTITGGLAYPTLYNNSTIEVAQILVYGVTSDGYPFLVQEAGIGSTSSQITRIQLEIGGPYASLNTTFILAEITAPGNKSLIMVDAYQVDAS